MPQVIRVGMAQIGIAKSPDYIQTQALGSCVGIVLFEEKACIGGIAHAMLPDIQEAKEESKGIPTKFVNSAIELLLQAMQQHGAYKQYIKAKLVGGANMFPHIMTNTMMQIGQRNIQAARKKLEEMRIFLEAEDVGGSYGRTIVLDTSTGKLLVKTALYGQREI